MPLFNAVGWLLKHKGSSGQSLKDTGLTEETIVEGKTAVGFSLTDLTIDFTKPGIEFRFANNGMLGGSWNDVPPSFSNTHVYIKIPKSSGGWTNYLDTGFKEDLTQNGSGWHRRSMSNFDSAALIAIENAEKIYACFPTDDGKYIASRTNAQGSDIDFQVSIVKRGRQMPH